MIFFKSAKNSKILFFEFKIINIMKEENKKTKILDKIPPGVLVPLALLGALALAGLLIWLGIKLSPVELRDPEAISAEKQWMQSEKKKTV